MPTLCFESCRERHLAFDQPSVELGLSFEDLVLGLPKPETVYQSGVGFVYDKCRLSIFWRIALRNAKRQNAKRDKAGFLPP
jgi:hypothetical protein